MRQILLITILVGLIYVMLEKEHVLLEHNQDTVVQDQVIKEEHESDVEIKEPKTKKTLAGDLFSLIEADANKIIEKLGEPTRKDPSAYGYEWWVYEEFDQQYIQIGIENKKVITLFATGNKLSIDPVKIGDSYEQVNDAFSFQSEVSLNYQTGQYQFKLKDNEIKQKPLVKLSDSQFIQFYFDTFTNELSSIRLLTGENLLELRPYAVEYWGSLPDEPNLSDEQWEQVQIGREKQILAITNSLRERFNLQPLKWDEPVSKVAFLHSQDMSKNNYFSHVSLDGEGLKERLEQENIKYLSAGENIAALYPDAPAAVEGWLNSEGHRKAMLNSEFTHIGIGVFRNYYTQNFLQRF